MPRKEPTKRTPGLLGPRFFPSPPGRLRKGHEELQQRLRRLESEAARREEELKEARELIHRHDVTFRCLLTSNAHPSGTFGLLVRHLGPSRDLRNLPPNPFTISLATPGEEEGAGG